MRKFLLLTLLPLASLTLIAQSLNRKPASPRTAFPVSGGKWIFQRFNDHILKASFIREGRIHAEQVSNAVILKPRGGIPRYQLHPDSLQQLDWNPSTRVMLEKGQLNFFLGGKSIPLSAHYLSSGEFEGFGFSLQSGERIFGGGERALPMDRRGFRFNLYNNPWYGYGRGADNLNYSIPFILSSEGYGIFFDNPSRGILDIGKSQPGILQAGFVSGALDFYLIEGKNVDEIVARYTELVGRQPIPARWVLGNFMSRFGYRSEAQVTQIEHKMKLAGIPFDAIIFDLFWFGDSIQHTLGNLAWMEKEKWPNPKRMIAGFTSDSLRTILITEPFILKNTRTYRQSLPYLAVDSAGQPFTLTDFYFGNGGIVDVFRKDARKWFENVYRTQIANGVAGWWTDLGEPEKHPVGLYHNLRDMGFKRLFGADEVHNIFGHYWNQMLFDYYRREMPGTRLFHLNRSGFAGSPRYSIFPWTGDVSRSWDGLKAQLPILLTMSINGVPFIHCDAGGFAATDKKDPELYTRWVQFSCFTPILRPHGSALGDLTPPGSLEVESEPVFYGQPFQSIVKKAISRRYELLPYNYTLAYEHIKSGKPLMRPLFYYDQSDSNCLAAADQYYWGDALLIAPVTDPGVQVRDFYLPGGNWYCWDSAQSRAGGKWYRDSVSLQDIPVFVRAGSFIPRAAGPLTNTAQYRPGELAVDYYAGAAPSTYSLYDDDGKTEGAYQSGRFELLNFSAHTEKGQRFIQLNAVGHGFPGRPASRRILFLMHGVEKPRSVRVDGVNWKLAAAPPEGIPANPLEAGWDDRRKILQVPVIFKGRPLKIQLVY